MKIAIATDHKGQDIKKEIINILKTKYEIIDCSEVNSDNDDYPDFAKNVANLLQQEKADLGVLLCGTGIGMSIAANKFKGIRCALVHSTEEAKLAKEHNHANIISMSVNNKLEDIIEYIETFINSDYSKEERHIRRVEKINTIEKEN